MQGALDGISAGDMSEFGKRHRISPEKY